VIYIATLKKKGKDWKDWIILKEPALYNITMI
jgi:hypothetical protein